MSILKLLNFVPDKTMIKMQYKMKTGRKLNLKNPVRYTEKMQWYKLYYKNSILCKCADKFDVREFVEGKGLGIILNNCYGCYEKFDEINFDSLPNSFVLKDTLGGGGNSVIVVNDKNKISREELKKKVHEWKKITLSKKGGGREWPYYKGKKSRILIEEVIPRNDKNDLPDYKFFCFNGKAYCLYTMINYTDDHSKGQLGFYDCDFKKMPYCRQDFADINCELEKPKNFDKMVEYAEILSKDFPHVRVDFYNVDGRIIFGELTFYMASGYINFKPDEFDFIMGEQFVLPKKQ